MFLVDDLAIADSNFMGEAGGTRRYTPTIDALASQSTVFPNAYATSTICTPSRYSLLTGRYPSEASNRKFQTRLATEGMAVPEFNTLITQEESTLPKLFQTLGYRTGFAGKDHVSEAWGYPQVTRGSRLNDPGVEEGLRDQEQFLTRSLQAIGFDEVHNVYRTNPFELPVVETRVHNLDWITEGAIRFIDRNADRKFFLLVSLTIPHGPLDPDHSWNADPRMTPWGQLDTAPDVMPARSTLTQRVNEAGFPGNENFLWLDDSIRTVLDSLQSHGLSDDTAIVLLSDHGKHGKGSIYAGGARSSFMIRYGGAKGRSQALLSFLDLQPTLLDMAGGGIPAGAGVSMMPVLRGTASEVRQRAFVELGYARSVIEDNHQYIALRHSDHIRSLAQANGFQLSHWLQYNGVHELEQIASKLFPNYLARDQLYDLEADPGEARNLYGLPEYQAMADKLRNSLQGHVAGKPGAFRVIEN